MLACFQTRPQKNAIFMIFMAVLGVNFSLWKVPPTSTRWRFLWRGCSSGFWKVLPFSSWTGPWGSQRLLCFLLHWCKFPKELYLWTILSLGVIAQFYESLQICIEKKKLFRNTHIARLRLNVLYWKLLIYWKLLYCSPHTFWPKLTKDQLSK